MKENKGDFRMKRRTFTTAEVIEMTRDAIHAFTKRDMDRLSSYLDKGFTFIADDAPLFLRGIDEFMESIRLEIKMPPVTINEEEYTLLAHAASLWVTFGRFEASSPPMSTKIHFTFVWQRKGETLLLLHANAAHARAVPPEALALSPETDAAQAHMFDTLPVRAAISGADNTPQPKRGYRDLDGHIRYVSDSEFLYAESLDKTCRIFVIGQSPFVVRTSLRSLERAGFMIIHRSYLVNLSFVQEIRRYSVKLLDGTTLPMGKQHYLEIKRTLQSNEE